MPKCPGCGQEIAAEVSSCPVCGSYVQCSAEEAAPSGVMPYKPVQSEQGNVELGFDLNLIKNSLEAGVMIYKKNPLISAGFMIVQMLMLGVPYFVPLVGPLLSLTGILLFPIFAAGYLRYCFKVLQSGSAAYQDMLHVTSQLKDLLICGLIMSISVAVGVLIFFFPGVLLFCCMIFAYPLIIDRRYDFKQALSVSMEIVRKSFLSFFVFSFVLIVLNALGAVFLGIGMILTYPVTLGAVAAAYRDVCRLETDY